MEKMSKVDYKTILDALDELGLALADHRHRWTKRQKRSYERSVGILSRSVNKGSKK